MTARLIGGSRPVEIDVSTGPTAAAERASPPRPGAGAKYDLDLSNLYTPVNGVLSHTALKGSRAPAPGSNRDFNPRVTIWSGTTEAPDETAEGDWLKLVSRAGLKWDQAVLQYLLDGKHVVERKGSDFFGGVSLSLDRPRPPTP